MEMCSGPGFMGFFLGMKYGVQDIHLVDIHPPCLESIQETNKHNNFALCLIPVPKLATP